MTKSWWPTNKWWASTATAAGTVALMFWTAGGVNTDDKKVVLVGLIVQRIVAYVARNEPDVVQIPAEHIESSRDPKGRFRRKAVIEPGVRPS